MMESPSLILLVICLTQCYGSTHFYYLSKGDKETLSCKTCQWEADVDSNMKVDCRISGNNTIPVDSCKEIKQINSSSCQIRVKKGFYACVEVNKSGSPFIYPFRPSADHVESFVVAQAQPDMVSGRVIESSERVAVGETINLTCTFTTLKKYSNQAFVVYWIKGGGNSSTCMYSYGLDAGAESNNHGFDTNFPTDKKLLFRMSNTTQPSSSNISIHNLNISNATYSDHGLYQCALQMDQDWTIITKTTVIITNQESGKTDILNNITSTAAGTTHIKTSNTTDADSGHAGFDPTYLIGVLIPVILVIIVIVVLRWRTKVPQTTITQRNVSEEDTDNDDCSPYAVSQREGEPAYSLIQRPKQKTDVMANGEEGLTSVPTGDERIMRMNSIYETSGP
ncbi:hypothetical protein ACEWY4_026647 [Coilia grayii]|uniref:Ig-like domain-containing protein n=1 Tax=Coilia grayii TaxID=363190 RepID=A0ABD1IQ90_9TELE